MAVARAKTTLVEIKAVDAHYPLYGTLALLSGGCTLADALAVRDGTSGVAVDPLLLARLGITAGDRVKLGTIDVEVRDTIGSEPDRISDGIVLGPRVLMSRGHCGRPASSSRAA